MLEACSEASFNDTCQFRRLLTSQKLNLYRHVVCNRVLAAKKSVVDFVALFLSLKRCHEVCEEETVETDP